MNHSDATQLSSLDATIAALRRGMLPPRRECDMLADILGTVRDRVARAKAAADEQRRQKGDRRQ
jgi:hypothetical protein